MHCSKTKKPWHFAESFLHEIVQDIALLRMVAGKTGSGVSDTLVTFTVFTFATFDRLFFVSHIVSLLEIVPIRLH